MPMHRRGFLKLLGAAAAAPFAVNAELVTQPKPDTLSAPWTWQHDIPLDANWYQLIQAHKDLKAGEVVYFEEGKPAGVAVFATAKGELGYMQVRGSAGVPVRA